MSATTAAFYGVLIGDATLTALLGSYAGSPSVFTEEPIPDDFDIDANGPYIITAGEPAQSPGAIDTKNSAGREIDRDVRCYASQKLSAKDIEEIAERVRTLFHRQTSISVTGFTVDIASAEGPILADEEDTLGRVVTVSLTLRAA